MRLDPHTIPARLQDLPPEWARFCLALDHFVRNDLGLTLHGRQLLVACSGGLDSTALLVCLHLLTPRLGCSLHVANLDHALRPNSTAETAFVQELCTHLGLPCHSGRSNVARYANHFHLGAEDAGRILRYRFLYGIMRRTNANLLVLGHHLNDLAEDVILRLIRGAGWPGLAGMPAFAPKRRILRPLLLTPRAEIELFMRSNSIPWAEDPSNTDEYYRRNRVRHSILPKFMEENPSFLDTVSHLWRIGEYDREYWEDTLIAIDHSSPFLSSPILLPHPILESAHPALRLRWYKKALDSLGAGQVLTNNLLRLDRAFLNHVGGKLFQFPGGKVAEISRQGIVFKLA